eukprot:5517117-Lingulodinium_polyedra.AAC.1
MQVFSSSAVVVGGTGRSLIRRCPQIEGAICVCVPKLHLRARRKKTPAKVCPVRCPTLRRARRSELDGLAR